MKIMDSINNQVTYQPMPSRVLPFHKLQEGKEILIVKTTSDEIIKDIQEKVTKFYEIYNQSTGYHCPYCFTYEIPVIVTPATETGRIYKGRPVTLLGCNKCDCRLWLVAGNTIGVFQHVPFDFFEQMKLNEKGEKREVIHKEKFEVEVPEVKEEKLKKRGRRKGKYVKKVGVSV